MNGELKGMSNAATAADRTAGHIRLKPDRHIPCDTVHNLTSQVSALQVAKFHQILSDGRSFLRLRRL